MRFWRLQVPFHRYRTLPLLPPPTLQSTILPPLGSWQGLAFRSCWCSRYLPHNLFVFLPMCSKRQTILATASPIFLKQKPFESYAFLGWVGYQPLLRQTWSSIQFSSVPLPYLKGQTPRLGQESS